jgi:hypothetical protein
MAAQGQNSKHLAAARILLDDLKADLEAGNVDPQTKATIAAAHATLVLAEQVAVARVVMATDAAQDQRLQATAQ